MNFNHVLIGNGRLPFEVLAQVFDYYLEQETAAHPMETLLLVCKAWNDTALGRPSLWAFYRIVLGDKNDVKRWICRLPLRLRRSGTNTPLHIDIASPPDKFTKKHSFVSAPIFLNSNVLSSVDASHALKLLEILAGKEGALCPRWETLRLFLASGFKIEKGEEESILPLTYPMPALTSLRLSLRCRYSNLLPLSKRRELFPELPSLDSIILEPFHMENYPDMSHARKITFHRGWALEGRAPQKGLYNAPKVEVLSLFFSEFFFTLPEVYPVLQTLYLTGPRLFSGLLTVSMPRLGELVIQYSKHVILEEAATLQDIGQIHTIRLAGTPDVQLTNERWSSSQAIGKLLVACKGLRILKADEYILSLLLEDWKHYLQPTSPLRVFLAKDTGKDKEIDLSDVNSTPEWNRVMELANGAHTAS
ncbi:hypothetical protein FRC16_007525 [Serendipita sp. 398]|nr:hypothetical protein FRC16_007525 [Serendipita sp. 398]